MFDGNVLLELRLQESLYGAGLLILRLLRRDPCGLRRRA